VESHNNLALLTNLYHLTMAQSYFQKRKFEAATFSRFIRSYRPNGSRFSCAGLKDARDCLQNFDLSPYESS